MTLNKSLFSAPVSKQIDAATTTIFGTMPHGLFEKTMTQHDLALVIPAEFQDVSDRVFNGAAIGEPSKVFNFGSVTGPVLAFMAIDDSALEASIAPMYTGISPADVSLGTLKIDTIGFLLTRKMAIEISSDNEVTGLPTQASVVVLRGKHVAENVARLAGEYPSRIIPISPEVSEKLWDARPWPHDDDTNSKTDHVPVSEISDGRRKQT